MCCAWGMENIDRDALISLLAQLEKAMRDDDESAFCALWDSSTNADLQSFNDNGQMLRDQSWTLQAEAMSLSGDRGELRFVVVDKDDQEIDKAILQVVRDEQVWKLARF